LSRENARSPADLDGAASIDVVCAGGSVTDDLSIYIIAAHPGGTGWRCTPADLAAGGAMPGLAAIMTYVAAIFGRPAPGQLSWADRLHSRAMRGTVMLSYVLPEPPPRQLDRLSRYCVWPSMASGWTAAMTS
jgi:hypothetical protein